MRPDSPPIQIPCGYRHCKKGPIVNPRKGQRYHDSSCRSAEWKWEHIPRCRKCGTPLKVTVEVPPEAY